MAGSERARFARAVAVIVALALGITVNSCGEFVRNNPFDPAVPVTLTVHGPDSAFAQFDTLHFTVTTDPVYDYDDVEWLPSGLKKADNNGTYVVGPTSTYNGQPTTVAVTVRIGSRTASKNVNLVFKPVGFGVRLCNDDSHAVLLDWIGKPAVVCTSILDARGGIITTFTNPAPQSVSLDTTVARIAPQSRTIVAAGNGTTRVVFTYGVLADTVRVTVRQTVSALTVSPAACVPTQNQSMLMTLGDTVRLKLGPPAYDLANNPITDAAIVQQAVAAARWRDGKYQGAVPIGVAPDGLVTATARGYAVLLAEIANGVVVNQVATCSILVQ